MEERKSGKARVLHLKVFPGLRNIFKKVFLSIESGFTSKERVSIKLLVIIFLVKELFYAVMDVEVGDFELHKFFVLCLYYDLFL